MFVGKGDIEFLEVFLTATKVLSVTVSSNLNIVKPLFFTLSINCSSVTGDAMWWTTNKGRIYRSYDFGHTFEVFQSPISDFGGAAMSGEVSFSDDNNGYLVNVDNTFWKTADGGESWDITFPDTGLVFGGNVLEFLDLIGFFQLVQVI